MNLREITRLKDLNLELMDTNRNLMSYLIQVYERNGITHDEFRHAKALLLQVSKVLQKIDNPPPRNQHPFKTPDESTEQKKLMKQSLSEIFCKL